MSEMEKKINALMRLATAEDSGAVAEAKAEIAELLKSTGAVTAEPRNLEFDIMKVLTNLGMPEHILGHRYTVEAIRLAVRDIEVMDAMTTELYPAVAEVFNTTPSRTERAIRHAIEVAWDRCDLDTTKEYFGNSISANKGKPTNSEFIARVSNIIRNRMREAA